MKAWKRSEKYAFIQIRQRGQGVSVKNMWGRPTTSPRTALSLASKLLLYDNLSCYPVQCAVLLLSDYLLRLFRWSLRWRIPQIFLPAPPCPLCRFKVNSYLLRQISPEMLILNQCPLCRIGYRHEFFTVTNLLCAVKYVSTYST